MNVGQKIESFAKEKAKQKALERIEDEKFRQKCIAEFKADRTGEDATRPRWYIIPRRNRWREYWEYIVMSVAIYNCIWTPLTISFDLPKKMEEEMLALKVIEIAILTLYILDILIQFLTSYNNLTSGEEIMKPSMIARRYMVDGDFIIDFLSTFPFTHLGITSHTAMTIFAAFQLLKVLRIRKIYSVISHSNVSTENKALLKIGFFSLLIVLYTHIIACVIWYFFKSEYLYVAPTDFGNIRSRLQDPWWEFSPEDGFDGIMSMRTEFEIFFFQWIECMYIAAISQRLVEVTARS